MKQTKKLVLTGAIVGSLLTAGVTHAASQIKLIINGKEVYSQVAPQVIDGTTMVPLRLVAETLSAEVEYDQATNSIYVTSGQAKIPTDLPTKNVATKSHLVGEWYIDDGTKLFITNHKDNKIEGKIIKVNGLEFKVDGVVDANNTAILNMIFDEDIEKYLYAVRNASVDNDEKKKLAENLMKRGGFYHTYKFTINNSATSYEVERINMAYNYNFVTLNVTSVEPNISNSKTYTMTKVK